MGGAHAEAEGAAAGLRAPHRPVLLMAGWRLLSALLLLLLALLGAQPCSCGRAPASSQSVTARLAAKWPATPLLLEARCVQPPLPPYCFPRLPRGAVRPGKGSSGDKSPGCLLGVGGASLRGRRREGSLSSLRCAGGEGR